MDYKFLAKTEIEKLFEESDLNTSDIIEILYLTKTKLENKNKSVKITDKMLYEAIEEVFEDVLSDTVIEDDKEWEKTINKVFKIEENEQ